MAIEIESARGQFRRCRRRLTTVHIQGPAIHTKRIGNRTGTTPTRTTNEQSRFTTKRKQTIEPEHEAEVAIRAGHHQQPPPASRLQIKRMYSIQIIAEIQKKGSTRFAARRKDTASTRCISHIKTGWARHASLSTACLHSPRVHNRPEKQQAVTKTSQCERTEMREATQIYLQIVHTC